MKKSASGKISAAAQRTYSLLSSSLLSLLEEKPFEKITTTDICKGADVPRATFYNHFEDKYDLLRYTLHLAAKGIEPSPENKPGTDKYIIEVIDRLLIFTSKNQKLIKKISSVNCNSVLYTEIKNMIFEDLYKIMRMREAEGKKYSANIKVLAEFYANGIVYSAGTWLEKGMDIPKKELIESMKSILCSDT